jgi:hypothetical protein
MGSIVTQLTADRRARQIELERRWLTILERLAADPTEGSGAELVVLDHVPEDPLDCGMDVTARAG